MMTEIGKGSMDTSEKRKAARGGIARDIPATRDVRNKHGYLVGSAHIRA